MGDTSAPLDVAEWMAHPASARHDLAVVAGLMTDYPCPWFFCGGWAIELFLGMPTRSHKDIDIGIFRANQLVLQSYLVARGWELAIANSGVLTRWQSGMWLDLPLHTIWCRHPQNPPRFVEVLFNEGDAVQFRFRRNPALTHAGTNAVLDSVDGLPYLAPEIALVYKSAHADEDGNQRDFALSLPALSPAQRDWLRQGLLDQAPNHPWLADVGN